MFTLLVVCFDQRLEHNVHVIGPNAISDQFILLVVQVMYCIGDNLGNFIVFQPLRTWAELIKASIPFRKHFLSGFQNVRQTLGWLHAGKGAFQGFRFLDELFYNIRWQRVV